MASLNRAERRQPEYTHGGSVTVKISPYMRLRRAVLSCLLWENEFYEDGVSIADRIQQEANLCSPKEVAELAIEARRVHGLRHVPLLLLVNLLRRNDAKDISVRNTIRDVISRPDEMGELITLYWNGKKTPLDKQLQRGLADAFLKFNEYSLAKYNRDVPIKIRDVMFMCHPKPNNEEKAELFKRIAEKKMETPDTWEVELSAGKDKKETFERLIRDGKLGYLALLRNLRNMVDANCSEDLVREAILARKGADLVFPFRFTAAARYAPRFERELDQALIATVLKTPVLKGSTGVFVDVSGSMRGPRISAKSELSRLDAAATLASMVNAEKLRVFTFADTMNEVAPRLGMAGVDQITRARSGGTNLYDCIDRAGTMGLDRVIFITDEQDTSRRGTKPKAPAPKSYMINVASYRNGIGYGDWVHLDGFSEAILRFITIFEEFK